jgi:hypothetical protein
MRQNLLAIHHVSDQRLNDLCLLATDRELTLDLRINRSSVINIPGRTQVATAKNKSARIFSYNVISQLYQYYKVLIVFEAGLTFEHLL